MNIYEVNYNRPEPPKGPYKKLGCAKDSKNDRVRYSQSDMERV